MRGNLCADRRFIFCSAGHEHHEVDEYAMLFVVNHEQTWHEKILNLEKQKHGIKICYRVEIINYEEKLKRKKIEHKI